MTPDTRLAIGAALALAVPVVVLYGLRLGSERFGESEEARAGEVRR